jgi:hypothetical protein
LDVEPYSGILASRVVITHTGQRLSNIEHTSGQIDILPPQGQEFATA